MNDVKYIGMDVHQTTTSIVVLDAAGKKSSSTVVQPASNTSHVGAMRVPKVCLKQ
ncbi:MAG TPA: hypothetical protein VG206_06950 [Terriglobia bacterium]|nr:hypothetical protein [Terriglobia bacterium]